MILTITLNPSIDRRYNIEDFERGKVYRPTEFQFTPGGKGLNVTRVIRDLGEMVLATGFLGGFSGNYIQRNLDEMQIKNDFLFINGETRSCLNIISRDGIQTEILEPGPLILDEDISKFYCLYDKLLDKYEVICASGSLPRGLDKNTYKSLIQKANEKGKKFILDTSGEALRLGIDAKPYLIKPNKEELERLVGLVITNENDIIRAVKPILKAECQVVVVSLGEEGALVFYENFIYRVIIPKIKAINPVGSGDSMIAGFAVSLVKNYEFKDMLKFATACGVANAMELETGKVSIDNIKRVISQISVERVNL